MPTSQNTPIVAFEISIRGIVQGVGFRPFVHRIAEHYGVSGWVRNDGAGVKIHAEGPADRVAAFVDAIRRDAPPAAMISGLETHAAQIEQLQSFEIRASDRRGAPTVGISPDLPVCDDCLHEMSDIQNRRRGYPYINCTHCGPRYSIVRSLPYDRRNTTMAAWPMCPACEAEYRDPRDRRFHAQPTACPACGPTFVLRDADASNPHAATGDEAIRDAARRLSVGQIVALKGVGGFHLACDARNAEAVEALRTRKFRKERPLAVLARDLDDARRIAELTAEHERLLTSPSRPIVLARAIMQLRGVAPDTRQLGVMLPYAPLHHLLLDAGAPTPLVLTSGNRSSEPIAYRDDDALQRLSGIADAMLVGEREIARRVDDSVVAVVRGEPLMLRRSRGYSPGVVTSLPTATPILALGADLKNTITLVVNGEAFVSQHVGDLDDYDTQCAFRETVEDLLRMYEVDRDRMVIVHDLHPEFVSTRLARELWDRRASAGGQPIAIQHHHAHIASVLAEHGRFDQLVVGVAFDGTGYGDDGAIWGGEYFIGSLRDGFVRRAALRSVQMPGGDGAAMFPQQAAAGFLAELEYPADLSSSPFEFGNRYFDARRLVATGLRCFPSSSMGRLFDTVAALCGFTRACTYEGQAAAWLEARATDAGGEASAFAPYPFDGIDPRPMLAAIIADRRARRRIEEIAASFHSAIATGASTLATRLAREQGTNTVALSGGCFQNELLLMQLEQRLLAENLTPIRNRDVPPNDGGISLGQAALAALQSAH
ncbi:MAG: carbamoyltransferase HypF [Phycisphaerae bacterium]